MLNPDLRPFLLGLISYATKGASIGPLDGFGLGGKNLTFHVLSHRH